MKIIYIAAAWNDDEVVMRALNAHFDILTSYLEMEEVGRVMAKGAGYPGKIDPPLFKRSLRSGQKLIERNVKNEV